MRTDNTQLLKDDFWELMTEVTADEQRTFLITYSEPEEYEEAIKKRADMEDYEYVTLAISDLLKQEVYADENIVYVSTDKSSTIAQRHSIDQFIQYKLGSCKVLWQD